jgi:hypothetical protein
MLLCILRLLLKATDVGGTMFPGNRRIINIKLIEVLVIRNKR